MEFSISHIGANRTHVRQMQPSPSTESLAWKTLQSTLDEYSTTFSRDFNPQYSATNATPAELEDELIRTRALVTRQHELIKQMRLEMDIQAGHLKILRFENDHLRRAAVEAHSQQEAEEEQITNRLLKRIDGLKKEKSEIVSQMEVEEEHITNTLRKRLNDMQKEKIDLEIAMEQEQEFIVNRLTRQMSELKRQQSSSANLNAGQSNEGSNLGDAEPSEELLKLRDSLAVMEAEHQRRIDDYQRIIDGLRREINRITDSENSLPMPPPATPQAASGSLNGISKK